MKLNLKASDLDPDCKILVTSTVLFFNSGSLGVVTFMVATSHTLLVLGIMLGINPNNNNTDAIISNILFVFIFYIL